MPPMNSEECIVNSHDVYMAVLVTSMNQFQRYCLQVNVAVSVPRRMVVLIGVLFMLVITSPGVVTAMYIGMYSCKGKTYCHVINTDQNRHHVRGFLMVQESLQTAKYTPSKETKPTPGLNAL